MDPIPHRAKIQTKLLRWFEENGRDLPWRNTRDPYPIWVSEIMLQQTQVVTVIPYYQRFLKSFPTVYHLARADLSRVLKAWEGLGYYSRARNLHRASKMFVNHLSGKFPDSLESLLTLPGIGRSTAGAILSFAFNKEAPVLDGNVKRVLSRVFAISTNSKQSLWKISESLIPKGRSNPFNQALMDLGSMICTPKDPLCPRCPLNRFCEARALRDPEKYPFKEVKKKIPHVHAVSAVIQKNGRVLLTRRPPKGFLGGLWEFPNWKTEGKKRLGLSLKNRVKREMGMNIAVRKSIGTLNQAYSHFKLTLQVFHCQSLDRSVRGKWIPVQKLHLLPMSKIHRKIAEKIAY
ncbi:MAG: A/G-specific adenine glycosylase [Syntrophaceae bacterium]|nr:A/G-specific adenine glycosylase [Syntrophaceae bacterium]